LDVCAELFAGGVKLFSGSLVIFCQSIDLVLELVHHLLFLPEVVLLGGGAGFDDCAVFYLDCQLLLLTFGGLDLGGKLFFCGHYLGVGERNLESVVDGCQFGYSVLYTFDDRFLFL
jgi:hypothetical protein